MSHLFLGHVPSSHCTFHSSLLTSSRPPSADTGKWRLDGFTRNANVSIAAVAIVCVSMETVLSYFSFSWPTASSRLSAHVALRRVYIWIPAGHWKSHVVPGRAVAVSHCVVSITLSAIHAHMSHSSDRIGTGPQTKAEKSLNFLSLFCNKWNLRYYLVEINNVGCGYLIFHVCA